MHVVGLMSMTLEPRLKEGAARKISFESAGISLTTTPSASAVTLGYSKDELTIVEIGNQWASEEETKNDVPPQS